MPITPLASRITIKIIRTYPPPSVDYPRVTDPAVRAAASSYFVATAKWGGLPLCLDAVAFAGFKGVGETRAALKIAAIAVLLNIVLNGPAIAAFGGQPSKYSRAASGSMPSCLCRPSRMAAPCLFTNRHKLLLGMRARPGLPAGHDQQRSGSIVITAI